MGSNEKAFQQIMQVSGRAGRNKISGNVIIQTYQPDHPVIKMCKDYKIDEFYNWEINLREKKNNLFRYRLLLKLAKNNKTQAQVKRYLKTIVPSYKTRVFIDVDPINFL